MLYLQQRHKLPITEAFSSGRDVVITKAFEPCTAAVKIY